MSNFRVARPVAYWWPVVVEMPNEEGKLEAIPFEVKFRRCESEEVEDFASSKIKTTEFCDKVIVDWRGMDRLIQNEDGSSVPFSKEALGEVLKLGVGGPIGVAFFDSLPRSKAKN